MQGALVFKTSFFAKFPYIIKSEASEDSFSSLYPQSGSGVFQFWAWNNSISGAKSRVLAQGLPPLLQSPQGCFLSLVDHD